MDHRPDPRWERFLPWLRIQARKFHLYARIQARWGYSDLVQNTVRKALEKLGQFRGDTDAQWMRWLLEILHTEYIDLVRHTYAGKRDPRLEKNLRDAVDESSAGLEEILAAPQSSPRERAEKMEKELRVAAALEKLPESQRDVIILFHYQEKSITEIANQLERTEDSVSGLLDRGRKKLREILKDDAP